MGSQFVEVGQLHVVAVDVAQQFVALVGNGKQMTFEGDVA